MYAYVQAFLEQVLVSVACNGAHSLKQRLARWLLTMRGVRQDGQKVLLAVKNMGGESEAGGRSSIIWSIEV
jgi:hypothetical protein